MPSACVKVITPRTGVGTETVTGINDARTGAQFRVRTMIVLGGYTPANTLTYQGGADSAYHWDIGLMHDTQSGSAGGGICHDFNLKIASTAFGSGYAFFDTQPDIFFGGSIGGYGYVHNVVAGAFDITWVSRTRAGDAKIVLCIGGSDYDATVTVGVTNGTYTTPSAPKGLMNIPAVVFTTNASGPAVTGAGGTGFNFGWAVSDGTYGVTSNESLSQAGNDRTQLTDRFSPEGATVSAWGPTSYTVAGTSGAAGDLLAFCGTNVRVAAGSFSAPAIDGDYTFSTGIKPSFIFFQSVGMATSASTDTAQASISLGCVDRALSQASYWTGDTTVGNGVPLLGARYLDDAKALRTGTPNAGSTTFANLMEVTGITSLGDVTVAFTDTDGTTPEILWFAVGVDATVAETPIEYENPCEIIEPKIYCKLTTEDEVLKFGVSPLRDSAALGGYAEPRLIEVSPITKVASDPATGAWSAQTATMKWADTDRANRERSEARTSFRACDAEIYITSNERRLVNLPPRSLFAGTVYEDSADPNLVLSTTINDLIGSNYSLFSEEKQIPQRVIERNWFPNAPEDSLGQAEPIVGGRRAPLNPAALVTAGLPQGISTGVYVGQVQINGSHGTPTGTTLADIVAALNTSGAAGTIYVDWGFKIGYGDAVALQSYYDSNGTVPTDYDALAHIIGYSDLDAWLAEEAHTGGDLYEAVVIAGHAISEILMAANTEPSIWVGDTQVALADIGVSVWAPQIPGDTSWASDIGADLFTDILGSDGTTRRYTLILFDPAGTHGLAVAGGAVVHVDCVGLEDAGDGTGSAVTDYFELYRHVLINFILQDWQTGSWLASPQFLFPDGITLVDRVASTSFDTASDIAALALPGGYIGSFTIGDRASVRDIIARFNFSGGCLLAQDDYQQLVVKVLDTRRTPFLTGRFSTTPHRTLRDKVDILPGLKVDAKPDWQVNKLTYQYAFNNFAGSYERNDGGGGNSVFVEDIPSQDRDGVIKKTVEFPYVTDDATADAVANYYLQLFKDLPRVVTYSRRGLCGVEDDLLEGVPISHFNGYGENGWQDHAVWIIGKTFDPKRLVASFTALDIEGRLLAEENPAPDPLMLDPVALEELVDDVSGETLYADT